MGETEELKSAGWSTVIRRMPEVSSGDQVPCGWDGGEQRERRTERRRVRDVMRGLQGVNVDGRKMVGGGGGGGRGVSRGQKNKLPGPGGPESLQQEPAVPHWKGTAV